MKKIQIYKILNFCNDREHLLYKSQDFIHELICQAMKSRRRKRNVKIIARIF